jgi:O-methyltransferase
MTNPAVSEAPVQPPEPMESAAAGTPAPAAPPVSLATLAFPHRPPFGDAFAERVPVLQAFGLALQNYRRLQVAEGRTVGGRLGQLCLPWRHRFEGVECGVFTGSSLLACAALAREAGVRFHLYGLDTFKGLPPLSATDRSLARPKARYLKRRMFTETSVEEVQERLEDAGFGRRVELRPGLFKDTLPTLPERRFHWVNVDCDLYEPHLECLEYFYPRMAPGGIVFFDDYHSVDYPMAGRAVDVFMRDKPEKLLHLRFGEDGPNITKSFFIKY